MRIADAVQLSVNRLHGNKLSLHTEKTGVHVYCVLPDIVTKAIDAAPRSSDNHFFWTGQSTVRSAKGKWQRRLDRTVLRTYRTTADLEALVPNPHQPRLGPKEDPELQRQIEANEGIFEPLLVEPHPEIAGKFVIIDGDRRWTNSQKLVEQGREQYRQIPVEVTDRTPTEDERLRIWIYIHRQRKEWDAREKEMVAYRLVDLVGRASAANILGTSVRELDSSSKSVKFPIVSPLCVIRVLQLLGPVNLWA